MSDYQETLADEMRSRLADDLSAEISDYVEMFEEEMSDPDDAKCYIRRIESRIEGYQRALQSVCDSEQGHGPMANMGGDHMNGQFYEIRKRHNLQAIAQFKALLQQADNVYK